MVGLPSVFLSHQKVSPRQDVPTMMGLPSAGLSSQRASPSKWIPAMVEKVSPPQLGSRHGGSPLSRSVPLSKLLLSASPQGEG